METIAGGKHFFKTVQEAKDSFGYQPGSVTKFHKFETQALPQAFIDQPNSKPCVLVWKQDDMVLYESDEEVNRISAQLNKFF